MCAQLVYIIFLLTELQAKLRYEERRQQRGLCQFTYVCIYLYPFATEFLIHSYVRTYVATYVNIRFFTCVLPDNA